MSQSFHPLRPFPGTSRPDLGVRVSCQRDAAGLDIVFALDGALQTLNLPAPSPVPLFTDGLWQHSCFELFIAGVGAAAYREFNFAPSGHWAAYAFKGYRDRTDWSPTVSPRIVTQQEADRLLLKIELPTTLLPAGLLDAGITAVLESRDGSLTYWALLHAGERPDFHRRDSFILSIPEHTA